MIDLIRILLVVCLSMIGSILLLIFYQRYRHISKEKTEPKVRQYMYNIIEKTTNTRFSYSEKRLFQSLQEVDQQLNLPKEKKSAIIQEAFSQDMINRWKKRTKSRIAFRRLVAAHRLSYLDLSSDWISSMIQREKNDRVLFYLIYFSMPHMNRSMFDTIMDKLKDIKPLLIQRYAVSIANHYDVFGEYLEPYKLSQIHNHRYILFQTAMKNKGFLLQEKDLVLLIESLEKHDCCDQDLSLMELFVKYLDQIDHPILTTDTLLSHQRLSIRTYGYIALARRQDWSSIIKVFDCVKDDPQENMMIINHLIPTLDDPSLLNKLFYYQTALKDPFKKALLARLLSERIDYIILKLRTFERDMALINLKLMIEYGYTSGMIAFINQNRDLSIEDDLFHLIKSYKDQNHIFVDDFLVFIDESILTRQNLSRKKVSTPKKKIQPIELSKVIWLIVMLLVALLFYPMLSFFNQANQLNQLSFNEIFKQFVLDTNRNLIYYFVAANGFYFILLLISLRGAYKQDTLWAMKPMAMLYEDDLLPAISIIAPAYNEEVNIITSIKSLLNLKYPKYEVIVVNDGSKDDTLNVLIQHFHLIRSNPAFSPVLKTKAVQGIFTNPEYPNLIVVHKENGGKADALNVGINVANHPYICGIDADSVLEQDALLRMMSSSLDYTEQPVALGGNIVPANGCRIDHGYVENKRFPKETLTRFQGIEYIRAFTTGRIGWSDLKSLLIISGAFGLFYKKDIVEIGGYITSSGILKKDSVGEDMELVVRLTYKRMKQGKKQYIGYIYHANCYTELPSDLRTLLKQRNRWHRGLIDILSYHRRIFLNPHYKQVGMIASPYFYIFEVLGPFFEWIGYLMLALSFILGFLSATIVLAIFGLSILMGIIISLFSLYIQESQSIYMSKKDIFVLTLYAIFENFGYRQMLSIHRVYSFFTALFEKGKWGEQKRKGI